MFSKGGLEQVGGIWSCSGWELDGVRPLRDRIAIELSIMYWNDPVGIFVIENYIC